MYLNLFVTKGNCHLDFQNMSKGGFLSYLRIDTIVSKCDCKFIYGKIMTEYLSIKQISENQEEWVLFLNKENLEFVGKYLYLF